ncbi:hypothetical protein C8N35_102123 [Breoghania corrubedonensis]|uniref:DUF2730 family protein n=1 Tax=Breoghania corrubedonensis TaxID=665038 RepID=A0A2T5VCF0_9HYPH|nr:hypothetical protein [Breoghania corrubedonensis]PTW61414.1 hypothetical protein C8N35_102123 [Breoghania corrubedonensis]
MQETWTFAEILARFGPLIIMVLSLGWSVYQFRSSARKDEFKELREEVRSEMAKQSSQLQKHIQEGASSRADIANRLSAIEGDLKHMPSADSYQRTELALVGLRGQMEVLTERLKPVAEISNRLQEFLLEEAKERRDRQ